MSLSRFYWDGPARADHPSGDRPHEITVGYQTDNTEFRKIRAYNATGGALVAGKVYTLDQTVAASLNPSVIAIVAVAGVDRDLVVATAATPAATWDEFVFQGDFDVSVSGAVTANHYLKVNTTVTADALVDDGTAQTTKSVAVARVASVSGATEPRIRVFLFGIEAPLDTG